MKNAIMLIVALIAAFLVWRLISGVLHFAIMIGMILLFGFIVTSIYKALTRQKSTL